MCSDLLEDISNSQWQSQVPMVPPSSKCCMDLGSVVQRDAAMIFAYYLSVSTENLLWKVAQVKIFALSAVHGKELFPEVLNTLCCFSCFSISYIWQLQLLGFYPSMSHIAWLFMGRTKHIFHDQPLAHCCQWELPVKLRIIQTLSFEGIYVIFNF